MAIIATPATIILDYAEKARKIYANRSEGDFTWEGLLYSMLQEVAEANIDLKQELGV